MNTSKLLTIAAAMVITGNSALAAPGYYIRGGVGVGSQKGEVESQVTGFPNGTDFNKSGMPFLGELAYGVKFNSVRTELQYHYSRYDEKKASDSISLKNHLESTNNGGFLNAFYDVDTGSMFSPYFMAGLGYISSSVEYTNPNLLFSAKKTKGSFAYQAGVGLNLQAHKNLDLGIGYRFINRSSNTISTSVNIAGIGLSNLHIKQEATHAGIFDITVKF